MITGFTGTPGSGKTYDAVQKILDNLRKLRVVYTNIRGMDSPECIEMIKMVTGLSDCGLARYLNFLEPKQESDFWNHVEPGSLIVLDEVQNIFNAREWQSKKNVAFNAWASTHRHHGFDLVLISQSIMRIDTAVRALVEWTYVYRKVNFFGSLVKKKYTCYAYGGEDVSGPPLSKAVRTYNPLIFLCYKSYVAADIKEQGIMKHVNVLNHPVFWIIPLVFGYFIYMLFNSGMIRGDLFGTNKAFDELKHKKPVEQTATAPTAPHTPYSEHTPSIYRAKTKSGQMLFSNRGMQTDEPLNESKHETTKK